MTTISPSSPSSLTVPISTPETGPQTLGTAVDPTALAPHNPGPTRPATTPATTAATAPAHADDAAPLDGSPEAVLAMLDPGSRRALERILPAVMGGDPVILMAMLANEQQTENRETRTTTAAIENDADARATEAQTEAHQRAARASRRASRMLGHAPKWLKKLIEVVVVAASAAATACTGGAAAGLAIAGAVLILGAKGISKAAVALGMSPENAHWLELGCKIAGAALMAGSGAGGLASTAASTATTTGQTAVTTAQSMVRTVTSFISASTQIDNGIRGIGSAVGTSRSANANIDAEGHRTDAEQARDALKSVVEDMQAESAAYQRAIAQANEALEARQRTQSAIIERMA